MRKQITKVLAILFIFFLNGCASVYKPINPPLINYTSHDLKDGVSISYKYDVLTEKGNRKYAKKENYKRVKVVSVKITNNTDNIINIGQDFVFYSGDKQIYPLEPIVVKKLLKQSTPSYILYFLLTPLKLNIISTNSYETNSVETYSIGYALGPGIALGNMLVAGTANTNFENELYNYNIFNRNIEKGETVYGIIGLKDVGYDPIYIKNLKSTTNANPVNDILVSIDDINKTKEDLPLNNIYELKNNLYKVDTNTSYENYYYKIIELSIHPEIETIEISREEYFNGNIKSMGLKAKHDLGKVSDDVYSESNYYNKIGTWRYFHENGQLKTLVDYNINEEKDGRYIEYDIIGNIIKESTYKSGKKIK